MTKIDKPNDEDRIVAIDDEKKRLLDLYPIKLIPPGSGIFDEPTRCYRANLEWTPVIMGLVSWLAEIPIWKDATDESHWGIQQILKFLDGEDCDVSNFLLRQNPTNKCLLEQSIDNGATWSTAFDFSLCLAIQDKSQQIITQNQVINVQQSYQEIYNNYSSSYSGTPGSVYPNLEPPTGDNSALRAALCNAIWETVRTACNSAISYYTDAVSGGQAEFNFLLAVAAFTFTGIALAAAVPSAGASLAALAAIAPEIALGVGLGAGLVNLLADFFKGHIAEEFSNPSTMEDVACYLVTCLDSTDVSLDDWRNCLNATAGDPNEQVILDYLKILFENDATYAAFLEKWHNNKELADAGVEMYCPCYSGYKVWVWDFENGIGEFTFGTTTSGTTTKPAGELWNARIRGVGFPGTSKRLNIFMPFNPTWRVRSVELYTERLLGIGNGTNDFATFRMRPTAGSDTGAFNVVSGGFRPNGIDIRCNTFTTVPYADTANEIQINCGVSFHTGDDSEIYLYKVTVMFEEDFAKGGYVTDDDDLCS